VHGARDLAFRSVVGMRPQAMSFNPARGSRYSRQPILASSMQLRRRDPEAQRGAPKPEEDQRGMGTTLGSIVPPQQSQLVAGTRANSSLPGLLRCRGSATAACQNRRDSYSKPVTGEFSAKQQTMDVKLWSFDGQTGFRATHHLTCTGQAYWNSHAGYRPVGGFNDSTRCGTTTPSIAGVDLRHGCECEAPAPAALQPAFVVGRGGDG